MTVMTEHLPIVFVHGMHARDKNLTHSQLWGRIPKHLESLGFSVFFGNEDAWGIVERNAREAAKSVEIARDSTGAERVHVIAHSKGGLDAWRLPHLPEMEGAVASVTLLATPLHGMKIADLLLHFKFFLKPIVGPYINKKALALGDLAPDSLGLLECTTTQHCAQFLQDNPALPQVIYRSLAFVPHSKPWQKPSPRHMLIRLTDGVNDGICPLWSSEAPGWRVFDAEEGKFFNHDYSCDLFKVDVALTERGGKTYPNLLEVLGEQMLELDDLALGRARR